MSEISARVTPAEARRSLADGPSGSAAETVNPRRVRRRRQRRFELYIWLFLLPTLVLYGIYTLYPIVASYWYSMLDWTGFDARGTFTGFSNYAAVLKDRYFWNSFKVTVLFTVVTVPVRVGLALVVAVVLNNRFMPLRRLLRTAFFLPVITTSAVVG